jgi:peptide/nickel transport system substrate-binding protein
MSPNEGMRPREDGDREEAPIEGLADSRAPWEELVEDPTAPRHLLAVMFTDIVGSTELAAALGDKRWRELVDQHHAAVRSEIARFGGIEIDTAGDAFFATFELPIRAVDCALGAMRAVRRLGLRVRAGVHLGECVVSDGRVRGVTVHIGARIGAKAVGGEVLVSSTVRDVLAGAGLVFRKRGEHVLKGIQGRWRLYSVDPRVRDEESDLPPLLEAELKALPASAWRRPRVLVAAGTAIFLLIGTIAYVRLRGPGGLASVPADSIAVIDAESGVVESAVPVRRRPDGLAAAPDGIWVANSIDRSVTRVGASRATDTVPVGSGPIGVAAADDFIWVANGDESSVSRVSRTTLAEVGTRIRAGNGLTAIAYGANALWAANSVDGTVWRIDPASGRKTLEVKVGPALRGLAVTNDAVWVTSESAGTLLSINPKSGVIVRVFRVGNGPTAVAVGGGAAWVANRADGTVARVDTTSGNIKSFSVGRGPRAITIARGHVFVANEDDGTVSMLDATTGEILRTIELQNAPMGLAAAGDRVWVSVRGGILSYRGGTLRLGTIHFTGTVDPSFAEPDWPNLVLIPATHDGLTAFKRVGGPEGNELVPNLAQEIRPPTDNGTTYTFTLRPGLKYSDGTAVHASDVRATYERILMHGQYGSAFLTVLKGSEACTPEKGCDLSAGVVTDDRARTIVFHLRHPLADFAYQLAVPSLVIVPSNAPRKDAGAVPLPGTGPYRITDVDLDLEREQGTFVLERNPYFEARGAAQPDGYPDRIEVSMGGPTDHIAAVKAGREDLTLDTFEPGVSIKQLANEVPAQLHIVDAPANIFLALNTTVPPFNDVRARQALNYAIDRDALAGITETTELLDEVSCQLLPKNTIGYIPYSPYTKSPSASGVWTGPDLAKARDLVARSGTAGQRVTVWIQEGDSFGAQQRRARAPVVASALRAIGYRPSIRVVPGALPFDYVEAFVQPNSRLQIGMAGWLSDYPAASNFVLPLATCKQTLERIAGGQVFNANMTHFCSPIVDALTERALGAQQEDPSAARDRWAEVDRALSDASPFVTWASRRNAFLVSSRTGNAQGHATYQVLITQMWVVEP